MVAAAQDHNATKAAVSQTAQKITSILSDYVYVVSGGLAFQAVRTESSEKLATARADLLAEVLRLVRASVNEHDRLTGRSKHSSRGRERSADQSWQHEPAKLSSAPWERGNQRMLSCTAAAGACLRARTHVHACARMLWRICVQFDCRKSQLLP